MYFRNSITVAATIFMAITLAVAQRRPTPPESGAILSQASDPSTCSTTPSIGELGMYYKTTGDLKICTAANTWGASFGASGATGLLANFAKNGPNDFNCDLGITLGTWADLPTCVDALVTAGGGYARFGTPAVTSAISVNGTFTRPINLGNTTNPKAPVTLVLGPGVRLGCNFASGGGNEWQNCINKGDGSGILTYNAGNTLSGTSQAGSAQLQVMAGSHVYDVTAPMDQIGQQQSAFIKGLTIEIKDSTALIADAALHEIDLYSGSTFQDIKIDDPSTGTAMVGILIDNGDKSTFTPSAVSAVGTTVTVTMAASITATPNATRVGGTTGSSGAGATSWVTIAGCNGGTASTPANANGTWHVTQLGSGAHTVADAQTVFQVTTTSSVGTGTVTGCTYTVTNSGGTFPALQGVNTVINHHNIVVNCGAVVGCRPLVISSNGASSQVGQMNFSGTENYEAPDPLFPNIEINGNGNTNYTNGVGQIAFSTEMHLEPGNNATAPSPAVKIRDAHGIYFGTIDASGCAGGPCATGNVVDINQSASNLTGDITIDSITNNNWPVSVNNPLDVVRPAIRAGIGVTGNTVSGYHFYGSTPAAPVNPYMGHYNPLDFSRIELREQWIPNRPTTSCGGALGWQVIQLVSGTCANSTNPTSTTTQGAALLTTGAAAADVAEIALNQGGTSPITGITNNNGIPWEAIFEFNIGATTASNSIRDYIGFATGSNTVSQPPGNAGNGVYIRLDTAVPDTLYQLCSESGGVETCGSTGVTPVTSTLQKAHLWSDGKAKIYVEIWNGTAWSARKSMCSSGCDITATLVSGSTNMAPFFQVGSGTLAAAQVLTAYRFGYTNWGLPY